MQVELSWQKITASKSLDQKVNANGTFMSRGLLLVNYLVNASQSLDNLVNTIQVDLSCQRIDACQSLDHLVDASGTFTSEACCMSIIGPSGGCKSNFRVKGLLQVNHSIIW